MLVSMEGVGGIMKNIGVNNEREKRGDVVDYISFRSNSYQVSVVKSRTDAICRGGVVPTVKAINRHARLLVLT